MSDEVLDLNEFLERVQDDKELLLELLDIFSDDYQKKRVQLEEAVNKNDSEQIKSVAHSLKGASGNNLRLRVKNSTPSWNLSLSNVSFPSAN